MMLSAKPPQSLSHPFQKIQVKEPIGPHYSSQNGGRGLQRSDITGHEGVGVPGKKHRTSIKDGLTLLLVGICGAAAISTITSPRISFHLGETYQIVVIGFLLTIMGSGFQRQAQMLLLHLESRHKESRLQNYDALLRHDYMADHVSLRARLPLITLFALPLGLSAGYKNFGGGRVTVPANLPSGIFGLSSPPKTQNLGNGISLMVTTALPFLTSPTLERTSGFNILPITNKSTAYLDVPLPEYVEDLRARMGSEESILFTADVLGTVCSARDVTADQIAMSYSSSTIIEPLFPGQFALSAGLTDNRLIVTSIWGVDGSDEGQSYASQARAFSLDRRACIGTWNITLSSMALQNASCALSGSGNQSLVEDNFNALFQFTYLLGEFMASSDFKSALRNPTYIDTGPIAVGAMLWARLLSLNGPENAPDANFERYASLTTYSSQPRNVHAEVGALRRHWALYAIILVYPAMTLTAIVAKALCLWHSPIGEGFGIISLLAGIDPQTLDILTGAALSGKLSRPVSMGISVISTTSSRSLATDEGKKYLGCSSLQYRLGGTATTTASNTGRLRHSVVYG